jgi:hypothetical protein
MTAELEEIITTIVNEDSIFDHLSRCIFLSYNKNKNSESIWFKDEQNNMQVIIRNYLNFNDCTFLGVFEDNNISDVFNKSLYNRVKVLCEVKNSR